MDILLSVLTVMFIALLLGVAVTFGLVLVVWFAGLAVAVAAVVFIRQAWYRWRFLRSGKMPPTDVIEGEYKDISPKD